MAHAWCNSCHRPRKGFKLNKSFISLLSAIVWPLWWSPPSLKSHLCRLSVGHSHEINTFQDIAQNMPFFHRLWRPRKRHLSFPERSVSKILYNPCPKTMRQNPGKKGLLLPEMSHDTKKACCHHKSQAAPAPRSPQSHPWIGASLLPCDILCQSGPFKQPLWSSSQNECFQSAFSLS